MDYIHRSTQTKVIARSGACALLGQELTELGVRRPLVLSGARTAKSPAFERAVASLVPGSWRVVALQAELGVPKRLRDIGIAKDLLPTIANKVMGERGLYFNPRPVTHPDEVEVLLQAAW